MYFIYSDIRSIHELEFPTLEEAAERAAKECGHQNFIIFREGDEGRPSTLELPACVVYPHDEDNWTTYSLFQRPQMCPECKKRYARHGM